MTHYRSQNPFQRFRDWVAWALCTFALKYIATNWYRVMIEGSIRRGLDAAVRESQNV